MGYIHIISYVYLWRLYTYIYNMYMYILINLSIYFMMCIYGNSLSDSITWYDIDVRVLSGKRKFTPKLAIFIMGNDGFKQGVLVILSRVQLWGLPPKRLRFSLRFLRLSVSLPLRHGIHQVTWWSLKISKQLRETMVITCYHPTWGMNELEHVTYVYIQTLLYII